MSLNENSFLICFGGVRLQNLSRHFTFEIIDYFKCHSNGSTRPHPDQMLEFMCNRPATSDNQIIS